MEATDLRNRYHVPELRRLYGPGIGRVLLERQMCSARMIVVNVVSKDVYWFSVKMTAWFDLNATTDSSVPLSPKPS